VREGHFHGFVGTKVVGSSGHHSNLVVEAFGDAGRNLPSTRNQFSSTSPFAAGHGTARFTVGESLPGRPTHENSTEGAESSKGRSGDLTLLCKDDQSGAGDWHGDLKDPIRAIDQLNRLRTLDDTVRAAITPDVD